MFKEGVVIGDAVAERVLGEKCVLGGYDGCGSIDACVGYIFSVLNGICRIG